METIMKRTSWVTALLLAIIMIVGFGCSTDKTSGPDGGGSEQADAVQVYMYSDTVRYLPGDSAAAPGWVVVTDRYGRVMKGVQVSLSLTPPTVGLLEYANIQLRDTTNDQGRVEFIFRSYRRPGVGTIQAWVGTKSGSWTITVLQAENVVQNLDVRLSKTTLRVSASSEDSTLVIATITDSSSVGIPNVSLSLSADGGRFRALPPTDSTGKAQTWWYNNGQFGTFTITVTAASMVKSVNVEVVPLPPTLGTLTLETNLEFPYEIQADGCLTKAILSARLMDQYAAAVTGDTIIFSTPAYIGIASPSRVVTDSAGVATARFCVNFPPPEGSPDVAMVVARHARWELVDTLLIRVVPPYNVGSVELQASPTQGVAGVDSASITIHANYTNGDPVQGLIAEYFSTCGTLTKSSDTLINGTNPTPVKWKYCNQVPDSNQPAKIWAVVRGIADTVNMNVMAGPARFIRFADWTPHSMPITGREDLTVYVKDSLGNPVGPTPVFFETTTGNVSPASAQTLSGMATTSLTPGTSAGQAIVKATVGGVYVDSVIISILSGAAGSIELTVPNPSLDVQGTGGQDYTQIIANVKDANGNPVQDGQVVYFSILAAPDTYCSINLRGTSDSALTAAGAARVTFNAGREPGPVTIQACTRIGDSLYCVRASNITVVAGPPVSILIQTNDVGEGESSVAWNVQVGAFVADAYNNPVRDGWAIFWELEPPIALILSDSVTTGNGEDPEPGIAYTTLQYPSDQTFSIVNITARTAGPNVVSATTAYELPLQSPSITLNCEPSTWHYGADGPETGQCVIQCRVRVKDGHDRPINGARVSFATTRGRFWTTRTGTVQQNYNITGPVVFPTYEAGYTELYLREFPQYIFPPLQNEITADIQVEIEGHSDAIDNQTVNFRRGTGR